MAILLLQCGVKQNVMPGILGISLSTLRNRLARGCDKTGVTNSAALLRHCNQRGWDNYIPPFFLKKGMCRLTDLVQFLPALFRIHHAVALFDHFHQRAVFIGPAVDHAIGVVNIVGLS